MEPAWPRNCEMNLRLHWTHTDNVTQLARDYIFVEKYDERLRWSYCHQDKFRGFFVHELAVKDRLVNKHHLI